MEVKINDIAKAAQLSRVTVSRVINGSTLVRKRTADRVWETMERLGYEVPLIRPGPRPRNPRPSRLQMGAIGFITIGETRHLLAEPTMVRVIEQLQTSCRKRKLNFLLDQMTTEDELPLCVQTKQVDGVVFMMIGSHHAYQRKAIARLSSVIPCVQLLSPRHPMPSVDHISVNDVAVGALAFRALRAKNCRSFVVINGGHERHEARCVRGRAFLDRVHSREFPGHCFAQALSKEDSRRIWAEPLTVFEDFAEIPAQLKKMRAHLPEPMGVFLTLENEAPEIHEAFLTNGMFSSGKLHLIIAGTTPFYVGKLDPQPTLIDLRFPKIADTALGCLTRNPQLCPEEGMTFLLSPRLKEDSI